MQAKGGRGKGAGGEHHHNAMFLDCGQTKAELPIHRTATEERSR